MKGIIEMPNMKDREKNVFSVRKKNKKKNRVKTREERLAKELEKALLQLHDQKYFRMDIYCGGLLLAKEIFMKDDASVDERSAAVCLLSKLTNINGMPDGVYDARWRDAFEGFHALHQFNCVYYRKLGEIDQNGYSVETTKEKVKRKNGFMKLKTVNKSNDKGRHVRNVTIYLTDIIQNTDVWDDFRKRIIFHEDSLGRITNVSFNQGSVVIPVHTGMIADFDGDKLYPVVYDGVPANTESEDQAVNAADDNGLFNKMNETISYLNSLSELEGWRAWHGTEYHRTDSKDHTAVIVPDKLSGVGTATWYELFYPGYKKLKHVDLIRRHVEAVLRDKYDYTISYPTKTEIEDEIFEADAHAWIDHPDTEKCGFAYTKHGNVTHLPKNMKLAIFPKNMKLAIFPMITITEKSDNT